MTMNALGKFLVFVHMALAVTSLTWAAGLYLQFLDWGWMEPRLQVDKRVASEFEKRNIVHRDARRAGDVLLADLADADKKLLTARNQYPLNYLIYVEHIEDLYTKVDKDGKPIDFPTFTWNGGDLTRIKAGDPTAPPRLDGRIPDVEMSLLGYRTELKKVEAAIKVEAKVHREWIDKDAAISKVLNGERAGKEVKAPGLYDLLEHEKSKQDAAKLEKAYLEPNWARALQEAEVFRERRSSLEKTLDRLRAARKPKAK